VQTGTHPRKTTEENIQRYKAQLRQLGLAHDQRRSVATTDVEFYRWTQWIFLQVYNSWYDAEQDKARPAWTTQARWTNALLPRIRPVTPWATGGQLHAPVMVPRTPRVELCAPG